MPVRVVLLAISLMAFAAAPAWSQPREIAVRSNAKFTHKPTKVTLPPAFGSLVRGRVAALEGDLDVLVDYRSPDQREVTTVYLYRKAAGDVPLWFDRSVTVIEGNPAKYGKVTPVIPASAFTPPAQSAASGLRAAWATSGGGWTSTALAILPVGDYLLKLRASSATLTPIQLDARLHETLASISYPRRLASGAAAVPVAACQAPLVFAGNAEPAPKDGAAALLSALMPSMADAVAKAEPGSRTTVTYCRDQRLLDGAGLYRPNGDTDGYLIAVQDAGRAVQVGSNGVAALFREEKGTALAPRYSVDLILLGENRGYGDFLSLPPPEQVMRLIETQQPIYSTSTVGKKNQISISSDALE